jgi:hypothetical protein
MTNGIRSNMSTSISATRLRRFAVALDHAVQDVKLEATQRNIRFFFDTDCVFRTIIGFTSPPSSTPRAGDPRTVIHALLTTPEMPPIRMLRPHLVEFYGLLQNQAPAAVADRYLFKTVMGRLIAVWGIHQYERALHKIHQIADPTEAQKAFLVFIREQGVEVFVKLQLCLGGTWRARLGRMWKDKRLDFVPHALGGDFSDYDGEGTPFFTALTKLRAKPIVSNVIDASALRMLHRLTLADPVSEVRFYTETQPIRQLFRVPEIASLLTCKTVDGRSMSLMRDENYFLMRTSFRALGFPRKAPQSDIMNQSDVTTKKDDGGGYTLQELESYSSDLNDALRRGGGRGIMKALEEIKLHGRPVDIVLEEFYKLEFLRNVVLDWDLPEGMRDWVPDLYRLYEDRELMEEAEESLASVVEEVTTELRNQLGDLKHWRQSYDQLRAAATKRRGEISNDDPLPQLKDDVGIGRWGLELHLANPDRISTTIYRLIRSDEDEFSLACAQLAAVIANPQDKHDLEYLMCVLWFLQAKRLLCQVWRTSAEQNLGGVPGYYAFYLVSHVKSLAQRKSSQHQLVRELLAAVKQSERLVSRFEGIERGYARMVVAHVSYWVWYILRDHSGKVGKAGLQQARIARLVTRLGYRSLEAAERAMDDLEPNSLAWYFAVNHAVYVGIATGFKKDVTAERYDLLQSAPQVRLHYRFADTLAFLHIHAVETKIDTHGYAALLSDARLRSIRSDICRNLRRADEYLRNAGPCYGDEEVTKHRQKVDANLTRFECASIGN